MICMIIWQQDQDFMVQFLHMKQRKQGKQFQQQIRDLTLVGIYLQKNKKELMYINMEHTFSIQIIKRYGGILHSLRNLIDLQIHRLQIIKENCFLCLLICIHLIKCGEQLHQKKQQKKLKSREKKLLGNHKIWKNKQFLLWDEIFMKNWLKDIQRNSGEEIVKIFLRLLLNVYQFV